MWEKNHDEKTLPNFLNSQTPNMDREEVWVSYLTCLFELLKYWTFRSAILWRGLVSTPFNSEIGDWKLEDNLYQIWIRSSVTQFKSIATNNVDNSYFKRRGERSNMRRCSVRCDCDVRRRKKLGRVLSRKTHLRPGASSEPELPELDVTASLKENWKTRIQK